MAVMGFSELVKHLVHGQDLLVDQESKHFSIFIEEIGNYSSGGMCPVGSSKSIIYIHIGIGGEFLGEKPWWQPFLHRY